jgi:hypothetical protein
MAGDVAACVSPRREQRSAGSTAARIAATALLNQVCQ